jgi:hypothetical protein
MIDQTGNRIYREGTADLLKGFAVLFMIQVHIMEQFATPDTFNSTIGKISMFLGGPPCAPVFMAVMGYFLAKSSRPLAYFLKHGSLLFMGGILLNTARSANLMTRIMTGEVNLDPWFFILGADILTLAGLSLMITGILRLVVTKKAVSYFLLAVVVAALSSLLMKVGSQEGISAYIIAFLWGTKEWSYFPFFPWYSYVLTGYAFSLSLNQIPLAKKIDIQNHFIYFIPLWVILLFTLPYAAGISGNLYGNGGYYHHGILYFGWILMFMISYLVLMNLVEIKYGDRSIVRAVKWIGKEVTILYVIQWLIIGNIATIIFRTQDLLQITIWFLVITLATIMVGLLFVKIRNAVRQ